MIGAAVGAVISGGTAFITTILTGGSARDALIALGSSAIGGAVAGVLLTPPPLVSPQIAGAVGGAISGFFSGMAKEYFRIKDMDQAVPKVRIVANVTASTVVGAVFGGIGGQLGDGKMGDAIPTWYPLRSFQMKLGVSVEITGCNLVTKGSLGVSARAVSVSQTGFNSAYDALHNLTKTRYDIIDENVNIGESTETHPK